MAHSQQHKHSIIFQTHIPALIWSFGLICAQAELWTQRYQVCEAFPHLSLQIVDGTFDMSLFELSCTAPFVLLLVMSNNVTIQLHLY